MKKATRVHRETLPVDLAEALLNVPFEDEAASRPEAYSSVGARLGAAKAELKAAVLAANQVLTANPLMEIIAEHAARKIGRRGQPLVVVDEAGEILLEIHYLTPDEVQSDPQIPKVRKSNLPPIEELRQEATFLGIDPEPFGKAKTKLLKAIDAVKAGKPEPAPVMKALAPKPAPVVKAPVMMKTAPAVGTPRTVQIEPTPFITVADDDEGLDALFGETPVKKNNGTPATPFGSPFDFKGPAVRNPVNAPIRNTEVESDRPPLPPPVRPPRRGTPALGSPPKRTGRSLSAIAGNAEAEVDIDAILSVPAPPPPNED